MNKALIIILGLLLTGCAGWNMPYPSNWAPLPELKKGICPSLAGKYRAISVAHPGYNKTSCEPAVGKGWFCHSLPEDLFDLKIDVTNETWVIIAEPDNATIDITVGERDISSHHSIILKNKQFECTEEGVVVSVGPKIMAGDGAVGANFGSQNTFRKALDGSLIMKETTSGGGLIFLVIPVAGSSIQWWKWELIE